MESLRSFGYVWNIRGIRLTDIKVFLSQLASILRHIISFLILFSVMSMKYFYFRIISISAYIGYYICIVF